MSKKHLLFLSPGFAENEGDTRCIPALQLFVEALKQRQDFTISIIALHYPYKANNYSWKWINVYALGGDNKSGLHNVLLFSKAMRTAKMIHQDCPIDQIHSFWLGQCAWLGNKISRKFGLHHQCTLMGQDVLLSNKLFKKIRPLPPLIALSKYHAKQLFENWKIKADHIIPWGVEKLPQQNLERRIDLIGVGNLTNLKSYDRFIRILAGLKKEMGAIQAVIIGEGKQKGLQKLIKEKDLEKNVQLLGIKNREEVLEYMQKAKALLHCANFESYGMVLTEGLASGMAVFSTAVGIAYESEQIHTYTSDEEAIEQIKSFLLAENQPKPIQPYPIEATINSYLNSVF